MFFNGGVNDCDRVDKVVLGFGFEGEGLRFSRPKLMVRGGQAWRFPKITLGRFGSCGINFRGEGLATKTTPAYSSKTQRNPFTSSSLLHLLLRRSVVAIVWLARSGCGSALRIDHFLTNTTFGPFFPSFSAA